MRIPRVIGSCERADCFGSSSSDETQTHLWPPKISPSLNFRILPRKCQRNKHAQKLKTHRNLAFLCEFQLWLSLSKALICNLNFSLKSHDPLSIRLYSKLVLHNRKYFNACPQSGPLSYCFGMTTRGKLSALFPRGELVEQEWPLWALIMFRDVRTFRNLDQHIQHLKNFMLSIPTFNIVF